MSLENWVILAPGVTRRMHFADYRRVPMTLHDKVFDRDKVVNKLIFRVDRLEGKAVDMVYSVVSQALADDLEGYLSGDKYRGLEFTIIKDAEGFVPPRLVSVTPYSG